MVRENIFTKDQFQALRFVLIGNSASLMLAVGPDENGEWSSWNEIAQVPAMTEDGEHWFSAPHEKPWEIAAPVTPA